MDPFPESPAANLIERPVVANGGVAEMAVQCGIGYMDGKAVAEPRNGTAKEEPGA